MGLHGLIFGISQLSQLSFFLIFLMITRAQAYVGGVYRDQGADVASNWLISLLRPYIEIAYQSAREVRLLDDQENPHSLPRH